MKWFRYIFTHSFFVAFGAVALSFQTCQLLHIHYSLPLFAFIFSATICSYNFYWIASSYNILNLKKTLKGLLSDDKLSLLLIIISATYCTTFVFFHSQVLAVTAIAALLTIVYSLPIIFKHLAGKLKSFGFLKTLLLAFTWAFVTIIVPISFFKVTIGNQVLILLLHRFLFMLLLCIIFDARDATIDSIKNLHSIATVLNSTFLGILFCIIGCCLAIVPFTFAANLFTKVQAIALLIFSCFVIALFVFSKIKKRGYLFYYFVVDGCMIVCPLITYLVSI